MIPTFIRIIKKKILHQLVRYIVWDFDGTLYQCRNLELALEAKYFHYYRERCETISLPAFKKLSDYHGSWSTVIARHLKTSEYKIINAVERKFNKAQYVVRNDSIVQLVNSLSDYQHIIFSNSSKRQIIQGLKNIGFSKATRDNPKPFLLIIDRHAMMSIKPHPHSFQFLLKQTKAKPYQHLIIGDSWHHDIIPAKKYGFQAIHISELETFFHL